MTEISSKKLVSLEKTKFSSNDSNQIPMRKRRRVFSRSYKLEILKKLVECRGKRGAVGELLRKEGLYSAQIAKWKAEAADGLEGVVKKRGPKVDPAAEKNQKILRLEKENARLRKRLAEADAVIDIQKKLSELMGLKLPTQN